MLAGWQKQIAILGLVLGFCGLSGDELRLSQNARLDHLVHLAKERCEKAPQETPLIYDDDYTWSYQYKDIPELFRKLYRSGKRLGKALYFDSNRGSFMLPIGKNGEAIAVPERFLKALIAHVEKALAKGYADYIFLADFGHGHFHIPKDVFDRRLSALEGHEAYDAAVFDLIVNEPGVKILYHSAEMFLFFGAEKDFRSLSGPEQFRNLNRNLVGGFDQGKELSLADRGREPVSQLPGFAKVAQDLDLSASVNGCLPFEARGRRFYFDISRFSPGLSPDSFASQ
ncbi:hypothetical protein [Pseudobacteriovorax antillogorgiicola]|uniref:Uncharacterized protein n=1 Tax=Pseudobacteriovorax antillogorgiicola TaxID=1513793 RepID=A0A1Y6BNV0_9BACT|nr:hypothetical protein [Pseudobacteriovorax antillogorgiicola]TCS54619.1 hypothetical protein EDD56_106132 [Pseudobacteriovorax antillogorgiicola]SMF17400.1 hypothetical protein SAMN06296036_106111 [Pseudobacteriovorax antillogorgiicola]